MVRTKKAYNFVNRGWEEAFGIEFLGSESEGFFFSYFEDSTGNVCNPERNKYKQISLAMRL